MKCEQEILTLGKCALQHVFHKAETQLAMVLYFIERCLPTCTTWPFVVTKTSNCIKTTSLLSCPGDGIVKEKDTGISYGQQKPIKLFEKLLDTLKADASLYVIDACSGVGSCGVACQMTRRKFIIIEKCEVKARLISQRLKQ